MENISQNSQVTEGIIKGYLHCMPGFLSIGSALSTLVHVEENGESFHKPVTLFVFRLKSRNYRVFL